jgi:hypothetical protein
MSRILVSFVLLVPALTVVFLGQTAHAANFGDRKVTISSSQIYTGAGQGDNITYTFSLAPGLTNTVYSMSFTACTTAADVGLDECVTPPGFSRASYSLASQPTGLGSTSGWTVDTTTTGAAAQGGNLEDSLLVKNAGNSGNSSDPIVVVFNGVTNPNTATTFYIRVVSYSDATFSTEIDHGVVAAATVLQITLNGYMPESLVFCVGRNIDADVVTHVPNCAAALEGTVTFNQLFSPSDTAYATSEMAASTNASNGYAITVNGLTLRNGSLDPIAAMTTQSAPSHGVAQFGLNLVANTGGTYTGEAFGADVAQPFGGSYGGQPATGYETTDVFMFNTTNTVASSATATDGQIFTVSYIVNVPGSQPAGSYSTALTYICTPTF